MRQSFDNYMNHIETPDKEESGEKGSLHLLLASKKKESTKKAKNFLADGLFAYQMIVEICKKEIDELFEDGVKYFNMFLEFVFDLYEEMDRKAMDVDDMEKEQKSR